MEVTVLFLWKGWLYTPWPGYKALEDSSYALHGAGEIENGYLVSD